MAMKYIMMKVVVLLSVAVLSWAPIRTWADDTNSTATVQAEDADTGTNATASSGTEEKTPEPKVRRGGGRDAMVVVGKNGELKAGETAEAVVVVGGSAKIRGHATEAVVAIGGDVNVEAGAEVGEDVVAIMGSVRVAKGAIIHGDAVAVGGTVDAEDGAKIEGQKEEVELGAIGLGKPEWLRKWFTQCVLKLRPLAPGVPWVWGVAGCMFLLYALIALAFPRPVQACVDEMTSRPATTFLMGLLTKLLLPLVLLILIVTGIGIFVVPFVLAALILGALVGKVALLELLGSKVIGRFGAQGHQPLLALLVGALIICALYMIPVLGLLVLGITAVWGLGAAVTAAFGGYRREAPQKQPPVAPPSPVAPIMPAAAFVPMAVSAAPAGAGFAATTDPIAAAGQLPGAEPGGPTPLVSPSATAQSTPAPALPVAPPVVPEVLSFPRASFWERMAAAFLDIVLVSILGSIVHVAPLGFLVALAYFSGMWAWKQTTIGGIVLGLKVARVDGQPITFVVALVRALAAAFSAMVLFLGFLWIAWDSEKQGWHDRIAGTVVLKLPRGTPLVVL
jgi:uncharacterized RDD family membrane protein YckC